MRKPGNLPLRVAVQLRHIGIGRTHARTHVILLIQDLHIRVVDRGPGIAPAEHERVFDKFYRLDPDLNRGVSGTGLGLFICREIVRGMNGTIRVESTEGRGSVFSVELPAAG